MVRIWQQKRFTGLAFASVALVILFGYLSAGLSAGEGNLLMPLDDVYIHFQYAKQLALGQPNVYNPGEAPTSGATSFLYPFVLAAGWLLGFHDLWLGLWAMLVGTLALVAAMWAVLRLGEAADLPHWLVLGTALAFGFTGSINWHFISGMETGLMIALTLWLLLAVVEKRLPLFVMIAVLLTLTRPEGGILALIASATMFLRLWRDPALAKSRRWRMLWLVLPALALGVQPVVNWLITGTTVASGNQAKSILAIVPRDWQMIVTLVGSNFTRMWAEFVSGYGQEGWYLPPLLGVVALLALFGLLFRRSWRLVGLMVIGWFLAVTAAVATLDTAFWHFKRYQMPLIALLFPLAAWGIGWLYTRGRLWRIAVYAYGLVVVGFALGLLAQFLGLHQANVRYVYQQPYAMAQWLRDNTAPDAVIAVHDVGMMRFLGERTTLDMVGLTTPGAAAYWRNGPGSMAEFLLNEQPDYIASYGYGHGYGLAYLADTAIYGEPLALFTIENWERSRNVALAADTQGIYQPDWAALERDHGCPAVAENTIWSLDVGDLASEAAADYVWKTVLAGGFVSEVREAGGVVDGYRLLNREESFTVTFPQEFSGMPLLLTTRVHAGSAGSFVIYIDEQPIATRWVPEMPGEFMLIQTLIPPELLQSQLRVRTVPQVEGGYYMPACHALAPYDSNLPSGEAESIATYQDGALALTRFDICKSCADELLVINIAFTSRVDVQGDYRFFLHVYDDVQQPPVAQWDGYYNGAPVGNWLPGEHPQQVSLSIANLEPGTYSVAVGFYDPNAPSDRLSPASDSHMASADGRLWLGEINIEE